MKTKQKLVIALATLTAGVLAAGATSTVAWFVANREATFSYNTITVNASVGDLKIKYGGSLLNGEDGAGHTTFAYSDSVTMTGTNLTKLYDVSSNNGSTFVKAVQSGSNITFASTNDGFLRFYVALQNGATSAAKILLKSSGCAITNNGNGEAANDVRVAVDQLVDTVPTAKGTTAITFMDGGANTYYATTSTTATYTPATGTTSAALSYGAAVGSTGGLVSDSAIKLDINATGDSAVANTELGTIDAAADLDHPVTHYCVVTVWYEGANQEIQNADIGKSFNLALDFIAEEVTA